MQGRILGVFVHVEDSSSCGLFWNPEALKDQDLPEPSLSLCEMKI